MPRLIVTKGKQSGTEYRVEDEPVTFGRLTSSDVPIQDTKASRSHARIELKDGVYEVVDLDSANGTLVNGQPITRRKLYGGDVITIGATSIKFQQDSVRRVRPAAAPGGGGGSGSAATGGAAGATAATGGEVRMRNEPLQYSKYKESGSSSFLRSDMFQEGGPLRLLLILLGIVVLAATAYGTLWLTRNVL